MPDSHPSEPPSGSAQSASSAATPVRADEVAAQSASSAATPVRADEVAAPPALVAVEPDGHGRKPATGKALLGLALGALGVVYGDIGTSPLYSLKECFGGPHGVEPTASNVLGVLSLVVWAMTFVVTVKYMSFVMRADNRGEGGILALLALVGRKASTSTGRKVLLGLGLFGAALLYGDGVITPAISVLSAVEGVVVAAPGLHAAVVPVTVAILVGLFFLQKRGTHAVGAIFGPIMLTWFVCIFLVGLNGLRHDWSILNAVLPVHGVRFFMEHGWHGVLVLGGVVLVMTGAEALYADMGHFGRRPIRVAWLLVAMPALLVNYLGQGALLLHDPTAARNPFFLLAPSWALYPLVGIATVAAIVASQALISGAFSLTRQAVQLGYSPRVTIRHTSHTEIGQIYIPEVNWALGAGCVALVLGFKTSSNLAAAYGIAVTGTMMVTTLLFHRVVRDQWGWSRWVAWSVTTLFLTADVAFFGANAVKIADGGWFPIAAAVAIFTLMATWKTGREQLARMLKDSGLPLDMFLGEIGRKNPLRVPGTAVFMTSNPGSVPPVLLHHLKHNKVLHERVILVSLMTEEIPTVAAADRVTVKELTGGFFQVLAHYGFMETPDVPALLDSLARPRPSGGPIITLKPMETTYVLGRETLLPTGPSTMHLWRKRLFIVMSRNAQTASAFFGLPPNRVVEMGAQIQL